MLIKSTIKNLFIILFVVFLISACGGNNTTGIRFDYSDAPPLPDTTSVVSKVTSDSGLIYYVIQEGSPESYDLVIRDDIFAYYTTRLENGDIYSSSFVNGSTSPVRINNIGSQSTISLVGSGFVEGVLGMKEGERRLLVIPSNINTTSQTITLDIELETIDY